MSDRSKLYLVSILGVSVRPGPPGSNREVARYIHLPYLMDAPSRETIEAAACVRASELFPKEEGFQTRHVTVQPVLQSEYQRILHLSGLGLLAIEGEPVEQAVDFHCSEDIPDPDQTVIVELNKPAN